ncbi:uncharacterized protein B0H64DRAFT_423461 [Chaetomium fimeti]|uniref:Uncharacterized protein n=1 Tax=Chaetomium fimeti TaxID=1854472 RepID=A0AAE0LTH8_9PEZI|nr:hypothetical protein B0H64DRAFT_423461 [Chaetomium fimeti]
MAGLAASRHAPFPRHPRRNGGYADANLTVPPAPTGNANIPVPRSPSPPQQPSTQTTTTTPPPPPHHPPTTTDAKRDAARHELGRYSKIVRRLQWKLPFLAQGYRQAVDRVGADPDAVCEAELMFKLDFFEYYMLVERALVHLLGVFGVDVPRHAHGLGRGRGGGGGGGSWGVGGEGGGGGDNKNNNNNGKGLGASVWHGEGRHRYHANVLAALDREENPLHGALGTGEVRAQLGRAKDLRNRWKTAADEPEHDHGRGSRSPAKGGASPGREWRSRKVAAPLDSYRLEHMLEVIFQGFDEGFRIAEEYAKGERDTDMLESDGRAIDWTTIGDEEEQWEFMVEAMDWEAV